MAEPPNLAPLSATFFTLQKRPRAVILPATIVTAVAIAAMAALVLALNWGFLQSLPRLFLSFPVAEKNSDPDAAMNLLAGVFGLIGSVCLFLNPFFILLAMYEAACLRWMIRGEAPGLFGLTLDNDAWRVYGVYWCWLATQYAVRFVASIVVIPFMLANMMQFMANGPPDFYAMLHWQLAQLPLGLLLSIPLIFIGIRLGPAAATSVARRQFAFLDAWKVTRGRFLALLGSFALLWLIMIAVMAVIFAVTLLPVMMRMWPVLEASWGAAKPGSVHISFAAALFTPQILILCGVAYAAQLVVYLVYRIMAFGVNARAALAALEEGKISVVG